MKTKEIYSRKMAIYLRKQGFKIVNTGINPYKPEFETWFFEDTDELQYAISDYMNNVYQSR